MQFVYFDRCANIFFKWIASKTIECLFVKSLCISLIAKQHERESIKSRMRIFYLSNSPVGGLDSVFLQKWREHSPFLCISVSRLLAIIICPFYAFHNRFFSYLIKFSFLQRTLLLAAHYLEFINNTFVILTRGNGVFTKNRIACSTGKCWCFWKTINVLFRTKWTIQQKME